MTDENFFMDVDGPEFINEVNNEIHNYRCAEGFHPTELTQDWAAQYDGQIENDRLVFNCQQIAVLDTNFLISNLGYLTALATQAEKYLGSLVVVVPWVVVTELDGLKGRNNIQSHKHGSSGKLGDLARRAMKFVQIALADQRGWLRGQKMDEVFEQEAKMLKGDDSILDCCRYFAQLRKPITLFTNDRNLAIKAMIHQVQTLSAESREKLIDYASSLSSHIPSVQQQQQQRQHQPHQQYIDEDVEMMDESDDIDVAQQQLQQQIVQDKQEIRAIVQNPGYSERNFNIWTSKHAPANYSPPSTANPSNSNNNNNNSHRRSSHINSNNYSWTDDAPVLDRNGEPLIPPSSSAGRLEEVRRRKQQQKRRN